MNSIVDKLKVLEEEIDILYRETISPTTTEENRRVISFKLMYQMFAFTTLLEFAPEYKPSEKTQILVSLSLKNTSDLVSVKNGKVEISPAYQELLKFKPEANNGKIS